jgi:protein SCO1/2
MARELTLSLSLVLLLGGAPARAQSKLPPALSGIGIDQKLGEPVPLDVVFNDETNRPVALAEFFRDKPVVLVLGQLRCPMLCDQVLNGLVRAMLDMALDVGKDFEVLSVSFDARETSELAAAKKRTYLQRYGRPGAVAGWHFLTGEEPAIKRLTDAIGFRYRYDSSTDSFAHASGIILLTPTGKIARYFNDVRFSPRDLRLGLVEASDNRIGSAVDQVLLFCFHYDPLEGKYGLAVLNFVRVGGVVTVIALAIFVFRLWRQERRHKNLVATAE